LITIIEGNILNATEDIIAHQVNTKSVMGGGLALQIKNKYPKVFDEYKSRCIDYGSKNLGTCQFVYNKPDGKIIANLFGQDGFGRDKQYTDYKALESSLDILESYASHEGLSVAIPFRLGSGLGGGSWEEVYKIIEDVFSEYNVTIYKLN